MKCPHCSAKVGVLSAPMRRFGKNKACPACAGPVQVYSSFRVILIGLALTFMMGWIFSAYDVPGLWRSVGVGLAVGAIFIASWRLRRGTTQ
jgi:hypothetical protein